MHKLLEIVEVLRPNQIYGLTREDGVLISVTRDLTNLPLMISEEFCEVKVELLSVTLEKQTLSYTIVANVKEEDEEEGYDYEFTLSEVAFYN